MQHYCSEPIKIIKDALGNVHYIRCNKEATYRVPDTFYEEGYYLCDEHAEYAKEKKWTVEKL